MFKVFVIVFSFLYISISSGVFLKAHYCSDRFIEFKSFTDNSSCCGVEKKSNSYTSGCCDDKIIALFVSEDHIPSSNSFLQPFIIIWVNCISNSFPRHLKISPCILRISLWKHSLFLNILLFKLSSYSNILFKN